MIKENAKVIYEFTLLLYKETANISDFILQIKFGVLMVSSALLVGKSSLIFDVSCYTTILLSIIGLMPIKRGVFPCAKELDEKLLEIEEELLYRSLSQVVDNAIVQEQRVRNSRSFLLTLSSLVFGAGLLLYLLSFLRTNN